ncbi:hypothetical protein D0Z70_17180 [Sphingobium terrigena]|jgi:hypothetical protein|uniref:Uncharacterized protein n=1 Tax=Sphingobium terrigena TaxID=2304063 RepID=A0A418YPA5_9SPHN|nr:MULTISPECIES: hypothetical protein [Sphingomonadaceae]RJG53153.1 hypothetical protein D0Z70_17180 [Sphingobium terrigena]
MLKRKPPQNQMVFDLTSFDSSKDAQLERMIEARVAIRAEAAAIRWRFRLMVIEAAMMTSLVLAAGFALNQPHAMVVRSALIVGAACFASGVMLVGLSGVTGLAISAVRRWRAR